MIMLGFHDENKRIWLKIYLCLKFTVTYVMYIHIFVIVPIFALDDEDEIVSAFMAKWHNIKWGIR